MVSAEKGARVVLTALVIVATGRPTTVTTAVPVVLRSTAMIAVVSAGRSTVMTVQAVAIAGIVPRSTATIAVVVAVPLSTATIAVASVGRSTVMIGRRPAVMIVVASVVRTVTV
ncbi:hypothetical protein, partial [Streptosporangium sp. NPDC050280]